MTLMHFDPFRDLERLTEQALVGARGPRAVERNVVSVRARRDPLRREGDELLVDERPQGEFSRQFFLGYNPDSTRLSTEFDRGVLMLGIPAAEASKPRKVEISSSTKTAEKKPQIVERASREEHANT